MRVQFMEWDCEAVLHTYMNGRTAIELYDAVTFEAIATASVNIVAITDETWSLFAKMHNVSEDRLVCIKDYSENEGMLNALIDANIVTPTAIDFPSRFIYAPLCIINEEVIRSEEAV